MSARKVVSREPEPAGGEAGLDDVHVARVTRLLAPMELRRRLPLTAGGARTVRDARRAISDIIAGRDPRLLVVVGPCSIHDLEGARDYLDRLHRTARDLADRLLIAMRVYFEKPRTTVGWKGFINDPHLDDSFDLESGLSLARQFLLELAELGMPAATEALDPVVPQYLGDLVSWYAVGARTTESQTHREMASGLSAPCGFKNGTDGGIDVAINAIVSARSPHHFLGIDSAGHVAVIRTRGNGDTHVILRGGLHPNYDAASVAACRELMRENGLPEAVVVDCSHGNSNKDPAQQEIVAVEVVAQRAAGNAAIVGLMLESNLEWGNQKLVPGAAVLRYGVSVTDACMDWDTTAGLLTRVHATLGG
jgi:3-deoxy-7-phosphoheptulonate synthase